VLIAVLLLVLPGAIVARTARLPWPTAVAVGPALTYGVVGLAIVPFGAIGIPWNALTALFALAVVVGATLGLRGLLGRYRDRDAESRAVSRWPAVTVAAGIVLGAVLIGFAAIRGLPHWQSIPSTWDAVWHANTVRFILDTGQASPTHMGELRNVETHDALYYPSTFHALAAVYSQLTGAAPATAYTLNSLAVSVWLFPVSAAVLTWHLLRPRTDEWRTAGAAATAAALSASFTAVPYVEFDTASMPNLAAYGVAVPTFVLIVSALRHRDRIPLAVLALLGVFSVHITGGVVTVMFVVAWSLFDALWRPSPASGSGGPQRGRVSDLITLLLIAVPTVLLLLPQFLGVLQQAEIIVGHEFVTHQSKKRVLFEAIVQHTRHLNDFPIQNILIGLAAAGGVILLVKRIWWPLAMWLLLIISIVHSAAPFGGPIGVVLAKFSDLFYSDPRRLSAVVTMLLTPMAGIALFFAVMGLIAVARRLADRRVSGPVGGPVWAGATAVLLIALSVGLAWHYLPRHRYLFGQKYDSVLIDDKDLHAFAYLATLPGARDTLIGNANTDGTAWMYAVADLHPLWTHYDYPVQQGPGYQRFIFWANADNADTDPRIAEAVRALNIRYVVTSTPVVLKFSMPDGLVSLDRSRSWEKIYDNGETRIYEWRGNQPADAHLEVS
jgi:D-galactosaminyltransferase